MPPARFQIPIEHQGACLRLHYIGESTRQIFFRLWPNGENAPVTLVTFAAALRELTFRAERDAVAASPPSSTDAGDVEETAELDVVLPGEVELALADLGSARRQIEHQLRLCDQESLADTPGRDARATRATAVAALSNALATNVSTELRATELRARRALALASLARASRSDEEAYTGPGFILDLGGESPR